MNKDAIKLIRGAIDAMYILLSENRLRIYIQCDGTIAENNPVLQSSVKPAPTGGTYINLNITDSAVKNLMFNSDCISFSARFSTIPHDIVIPFSKIQCIYSPDNTAVSMILETNFAGVTDATNVSKLPKKKPALSVVKN